MVVGTAIILAGGDAKRMGYTSKALVMLKNKPLIAYQVEKCPQIYTSKKISCHEL